MKKLSIREKVLLGLVGAAALFALISIALPSKKERPAALADRQAEDLTEFSTQLVLTVARNGISPFEAAAIEKAAEAWKSDPFLTLPQQDPVIAYQADPSDAGEAPNAAGLAYTGYVQMGGRTLAIINGLEYEIGETIREHPGLVLQRVSSAKAILVQSITGAEIILPIRED